MVSTNEVASGLGGGFLSKGGGEGYAVSWLLSWSLQSHHYSHVMLCDNFPRGRKGEDFMDGCRAVWISVSVWALWLGWRGHKHDPNSPVRKSDSRIRYSFQNTLQKTDLSVCYINRVLSFDRYSNRREKIAVWIWAGVGRCETT